MPDWNKIVLSRTSNSRNGPPLPDEVVSELASHLEDSFAALREEGMAEDLAAELVLHEVNDWNALILEIHRAKENDMNQRTRSIWLPSALTLLLSNAALGGIMALGPKPFILWISSTVPTSKIAFEFYFLWLAVLPFIGAVGASWSRRAGGGRLERIIASGFPSIAMAGLFFLGMFWSFAFERWVPMGLKLTAIAVYTMSFVVLPGLSLFLGALPFLRNGHSQSLAH